MATRFPQWQILRHRVSLEKAGLAQLELQIGSTSHLNRSQQFGYGFPEEYPIPDGEQTLSAKVLKGSSDNPPHILHQL